MKEQHEGEDDASGFRARRKSTLGRKSRDLIDSLAEQSSTGSIAVHASAVSAFELAQSANSRLLEAHSLLLLGRARGALVYPAIAHRYFRQAELIFRAHRDVTMAAECCVGRARALYDMGRERSGILVAQTALDEPGLPARSMLAALSVMALCHAHIGELDLANDLLETRSRPLVDICGNEDLRLEFFRVLAIVKVHQIVCGRKPELWLWHGTEKAIRLQTPIPEPDEVLHLITECHARMPPNVSTGYIDFLRSFVTGVFQGDERAVGILGDLAASERDRDPPLACWSLYFQALLMVHRDQKSLALTLFGDAMVIADRWHLGRMRRDIQLQRSRIHESLGDLEKSFREFKQFAPLQIYSAARTSPTLSVSEPGSLHELRDLMPVHVKRAIRFIADYTEMPIGVAQVAKHCDVGRRALEIAFVENLSMTIAAYIKRTKLERAASLLQKPNSPVKEIAKAVGYRWPAAFSRDFQLHFGASPSDWRRLRLVACPE